MRITQSRQRGRLLGAVGGSGGSRSAASNQPIASACDAAFIVQVPEEPERDRRAAAVAVPAGGLERVSAVSRQSSQRL